MLERSRFSDALGGIDGHCRLALTTPGTREGGDGCDLTNRGSEYSVTRVQAAPVQQQRSAASSGSDRLRWVLCCRSGTDDCF